MLFKKSIFQSPQTSPPINIISYLPIFNYLQSNWRAPCSSSYSPESHILYEDPSVLSYFNLELFRTALLEVSVWIFILVYSSCKIKSNRSNNFSTYYSFQHFTISTLHYYTITLFHHFTTLTFHHFTILITVSSL